MNIASLLELPFGLPVVYEVFVRKDASGIQGTSVSEESVFAKLTTELRTVAARGSPQESDATQASLNEEFDSSKALLQSYCRRFLGLSLPRGLKV
jgi:hypothetical protein